MQPLIVSPHNVGVFLLHLLQVGPFLELHIDLEGSRVLLQEQYECKITWLLPSFGCQLFNRELSGIHLSGFIQSSWL